MQAALKMKSGDARLLHILIVDDHPVVAEGWGRIIRTKVACEIASAPSASEGWRAWRQARPDLMVVDLSIGRNKIAGIRLIERLRRVDPDLPILVFTMHRSPVLARRALMFGANGIINKDSPPAEICAAFTEVARGGNYVDSRLAMQIALLNVSRPGTSAPRLTGREEEILGMITEGMSYRDIADRACISYKTVSNVSLVLKDKLGATNLADLVVKGIRYFEGD
ncbi:response regulator transcription factor [Paracoccus thiocyanatus]|uniref:DNA-binding response regulator n=1 Tax=Paracoccus thiocyanatus TaxID=34006 RepID=A0A3D8PDQ7_9RHOB|nr:response regulator transcription factor [Paracoccus thiocyanatus]RDW13391.1 DNA-binding response regulator [Paracoccus thiocyanatus]